MGKIFESIKHNGFFDRNVHAEIVMKLKGCLSHASEADSYGVFAYLKQARDLAIGEPMEGEIKDL
jgi:hypothetical protein